MVHLLCGLSHIIFLPEEMGLGSDGLMNIKSASIEDVGCLQTSRTPAGPWTSHNCPAMELTGVHSSVQQIPPPHAQAFKNKVLADVIASAEVRQSKYLRLQPSRQKCQKRRMKNHCKRPTHQRELSPRQRETNAAARGRPRRVAVTSCMQTVSSLNAGE